MHWLMRRAVFALCFILGTSVWYILAQNKSFPAPPVQSEVEISSSEASVQIDSEQAEETMGELIRLVQVEPLVGYANANTLVLRGSAEADAPVTAKVKMYGYESVQILDATRDFLRVRISADDGSNNGGVARKHDYEGWTSWGSIMPELTAIVMDAESGAVVSRVPLDDGLESVSYSPDGSKAIFYYKYGGGRIAREVRTSDYTLTRTLTSPGGDLFAMPFYSPDGDSLYATVYRSESSQDGTKISLVGISPDGEPNTPTGISVEGGTFFTVSQDGSLGFIARRQSGNDCELTVDVMEMATLQPRNTFTLIGTLLSEPGNFVLNKDGSELYVTTSEKADTVSVIDTWTGQLLRELPDPTIGDYAYFAQRNLVGNSLLFTVWEDGARAHKVWVDNDGQAPAVRGIDYAVEAGGRRYAIGESALRLFRLDANNRIEKSFPIARPELQTGKTTGDDMSVYNFIASPDGKHIIIIVGMVHDC